MCRSTMYRYQFNIPLHVRVLYLYNYGTWTNIYSLAAPSCESVQGVWSGTVEEM